MGRGKLDEHIVTTTAYGKGGEGGKLDEHIVATTAYGKGKGGKIGLTHSKF